MSEKDRRKWEAIKADPVRYAAYQERQKRKDAKRYAAMKADPDKRAAYLDRQRAKDKRRDRAEAQTKEVDFIGLDGEGLYEDGSDRQIYALLTASTGDVLFGRAGPSTGAVFDWLLDLKRRYPSHRFVCFAGNYDFNFWLKDVPRERLQYLWDHGTAHLKIEGRSYMVTYIPSKMITITRGRYVAYVDEAGKMARKWKREIGIKVEDCFGFYQKSFVKSLKEWKIGTAEDVAFIASLKANRKRFTFADLEEVKRYNLRECELLVQMLKALEATLRGAGIFVTGWYGAGVIASALMKAHEVKLHLDRPKHPDLDEATRRAYFGGRVQTFQLGLFPKVHAYDVNSCYPWAMSLLPSLIGKWRKVKGYAPGEAWALYRVRWRLWEGCRLGPFPYRIDKTKAIIWPWEGEGYYWAPEVDAAFAIYGHLIEVLEGYVFTPDDPEARPFAYVPELYAVRKQYKAANDPRHIVLKLGLNSSYGKLAQGSSYNGIPPFQSFVWAGLITSLSRAKLLTAASADPQALIAIATDGLWATRPLPIACDDTLGGWEGQTGKDFFILKPGLYHCGEVEGKTVQKSRGYPLAEVEAYWQTLKDKWCADGVNMEHSVKASRFIGLGSALGWNRLDLWLTWTDGDNAQRAIRAYPERSLFKRPKPGKKGSIILYAPSREDMACGSQGISGAYDPKVSPHADANVNPDTTNLLEQPDYDLGED